MELVTLVGDLLRADDGGDPSVVSRRTAFTMSAGDLNTNGAPGVRKTF